MTDALHGNPAIETGDGRSALAEPQPDGQRAVKALQPIQHLLTEVLDRQAAQTCGQLLQCSDRAAVIHAAAEIVIGCGAAQIERQRDVEAEPLPIATLVLQHPDMGPEPQLTDVKGIEISQRGRSLWLNWRAPEEKSAAM